jgi:hypothetical protein
MAEVAEGPRGPLLATVKKRWRAWLRAVHRDFGYLAIGFTVIYAVSGIAQNHIEDIGDLSFKTSERELTIATIADDVPDDVAIQRVASAVDLGNPTETFRAGDEIRLTYAGGTNVTALGDTGHVTIQARSQRFFLGAANWLHRARNKPAWKYVSDVFALMLLYLAISGVFMIKGKLGLRGRGAILISLGIAVPVVYVALAGGPEAHPSTDATTATAPKPGGGPILKPLPPD